MPPSENSDFGRAAAYIHHHAAAGFQHRQIGADGGRHRLFDQVGFARAGVQGRFNNGALLDFGDAARYADHDARAGHRHPALLMRFLYQIIQHAGGDFVFADDAIAQRPHDQDIARILAPHFFGAGAHFDWRPGLAVDGHEGGLIYDDAFAAYVNHGTQVNANVERE